MSTIILSVNLNKIALIRNSRDGDYPNLKQFAKSALDLGVKSLTVHPRPDQRHIRPGDVRTITKITEQYGDVEFNIEGNPFAPAQGDYPGLLALVEEVRPSQCTLVPDSEKQKTSDHGFDLTRDGEKLRPLLAQLKQWGVRSSLFMDPDPEQIRLAKQLGADRIELYTGPFAWAFEASEESGHREFARHCAAAEVAREIGLGINAGHDLNLNNLTLYKNLPGLLEVSIGHALMVDALLMGYDKAISAYMAAIR